MVLITPFRGDRFRDPKTGDARPCAAPPYDVLDAGDRARFAALSPANVVHLSLPETSGEHDRYASAADLATAMLADGRLVPDDEPTFHLQDAHFTGPDGRKKTRRGFLALVKIESAGPGSLPSIRGHEQVLPKPLEDRTRLLAATRANIEPVFLLYSDPIGRADALLEGSRLKQSAETAELGSVRYEFRRADPKVAPRVVEALRELPLYVADGHHRFTVSARHAALHPEDPGSAWILALLVRAQDPGLVILPTHRFITGMEPSLAASLRARIERLFDLRVVRPEQLLKTLAGTAEPDAFGVWLRRDGRAVIAIPNADARARSADVPEPLAHLDVNILERVLFDATALGGKLPVSYVRGEDDPLGRAAREDIDAAFFLRPPTVETVMRTSDRGLTMPPKSTYFFPKAASGQVLYRFDRAPARIEARP